jgi:hypothetical protein
LKREASFFFAFALGYAIAIWAGFSLSFSGYFSIALSRVLLYLSIVLLADNFLPFIKWFTRATAFPWESFALLFDNDARD